MVMYGDNNREKALQYARETFNVYDENPDRITVEELVRRADVVLTFLEADEYVAD